MLRAVAVKVAEKGEYLETEKFLKFKVLKWILLYYYKLSNNYKLKYIICK